MCSRGGLLHIRNRDDDIKMRCCKPGKYLGNVMEIIGFMSTITSHCTSVFPTKLRLSPLKQAYVSRAEACVHFVFRCQFYAHIAVDEIYYWMSSMWKDDDTLNRYTKISTLIWRQEFRGALSGL